MRKLAPQIFIDWYQNLPIVKSNGGPSRGTISAAMSVLDELLDNYSLDITTHITPRGTSINSASGPNERKVLAKFGEHRPYTKEGGRTNRGGVDGIQNMLFSLEKLNLDQVEEKKRNETLNSCQLFLLERIRDYFNKQRLEIEFQPRATTWHFINEILSTANEEGKSGAVAQHLIGAKLALRFPRIEISNLGYTTADQQTDRPGDFLINDTAIHVTVSPVSNLLSKCQINIKDGYKVYIIVPDNKLLGTRQNVESYMGNDASVESIESFVSQNIDELSQFSIDKRKEQLSNLLTEYNRRVDEIELDKSLMIEIPNNLKK